MAYQAVKLNLFVANGFEEALFPGRDGSSRCCSCGNVATFGADNGNLPIALDGVREPNAVLHDRAVSRRLEVDVNFIFDGRGRLANLDSPENAKAPINTFEALHRFGTWGQYAPHGFAQGEPRELPLVEIVALEVLGECPLLVHLFYSHDRGQTSLL